MQAVVNLAGEATKLRPLTCEKCGAMLKITKRTVLEEILARLQENGVDNVIIVSGYMEMGLKKAASGCNFNMDIKFVTGDGTDSCLKENADLLEDSFIYFSKPLYTTANLKALFNFHKEKRAVVTVLLNKGGQNSFKYNNTGRVTRMGERRLWGSFSEDKSGTGVYVADKKITMYMPLNASFDLKEGVLPSLIRSGKSVYVTFDKDCGEAITDFSSYMRSCFLQLDKYTDLCDRGIFIEEGATVDKGALLEGPCFVAKGVHIKKGATIGKYTIIQENTIVGEGAGIKRSIIGKNCRIGKGCALRGCILDDNVSTGKNTGILEQAIIGKDCRIGEECKICSFVKIWPDKTIESKQTVNENIMWGQKKRTRLFEKGRIKGVVNLEITPSTLIKTGLCIGKLTAMGNVGVSTDGSPCALMLRDGIISSLVAGGCKVSDFGEQPLAITRRAVLFYSLSCGVAINVTEEEGEDVGEISIIWSDGAELDDNKKEQMEEIFANDEMVFAESKNIKECEYVFEYKLHYLKNLLSRVKGKGYGQRVLLSCNATWGRRLITSALSDMGFAVTVFSPPVSDEKGAFLFEKAVREGDFEIGFITDSKCCQLTLVTHRGIVKEEMYELICAFVIMRKYPGALFYATPSTTFGVEKLAEKENARVLRVSGEDNSLMGYLTDLKEENEEQFVLRFDAVGAIIKLMDFLCNEETTIEKILEELPQISMVKKVLLLEEGEKADTMDKIKLIEGDKEEADSGVKITFDKGWVLIVPDKYNDYCHMTGEGVNMETAKELCDFCIKKIKEK